MHHRPHDQWGLHLGGRGWEDPPEQYRILSISGQHASYLNAFLFQLEVTQKRQHCQLCALRENSNVRTALYVRSDSLGCHTCCYQKHKNTHDRHARCTRESTSVTLTTINKPVLMATRDRSAAAACFVLCCVELSCLLKRPSSLWLSCFELSDFIRNT